MDIVIYSIIFLVMLVGLAGTILPALPGTPIIFVGIVIYGLYFGFSEVGLHTFMVLGIIAILAQVFDYLAGAYGAKKLGSTKYGIWGSIIGGLIGMIILNIIGLVLGVFLGAVIAEMYFARKDLERSIKIGMGSILGFLGGTVIKILLGIVMVIIFIMTIL